MGAIPVDSLPEVVVEEAYLLSKCGDNTGMLDKVVIEGSCSTSLRTDDNEVRQCPHLRRQKSGKPRSLHDRAFSSDGYI